ncbi:MAG: hypothetical protein JW908_08895 [Anaerolineales bacterium]|nr:hypothetical protein [Anaerolineales bacterium]
MILPVNVYAFFRLRHRPNQKLPIFSERNGRIRRARNETKDIFILGRILPARRVSVNGLHKFS